MKILFFTGTHFADCSFPLIKAFEELGHDVTTLMQLTPDRCHKTIIDIDKQPSKEGLIKASNFEELNLFSSYVNLDKIYLINHPMSVKNIRSLLLALKVRKFISNGNYDVIFYDSAFQFWNIVQYFVKGYWIYMVHDPIPHIGAETFWYRFHKNIAIRRASKYVLFNKNQSKDFCDKYRLKESSIYFNKLSIYDVYTNLQLNKNLLNNDEVLFFGRVDQYKGIEYLCKAMRIVVQSFPSVHLTIAGKGNYNFDIKEYQDIGCISFENRYISNQEMVELFSNASIVVCPYIEATQSGVIMTAFAFEKPVIASKVGGLPEMVEDRVTGLLVSPKNEKELSDAIKLLLSNKVLYEDVKSNINKQYRSGKDSWKSIAAKYIEIIKE